ncbi:hypothetical protein ACE6H2_023589 [Prunus campanulata]
MSLADWFGQVRSGAVHNLMKTNMICRDRVLSDYWRKEIRYHDSISKWTTSDSKDSVLHSSSKTSLTGNTTAPTGSREPAGSLANHKALHVQIKCSASKVLQRGEKLNQTTSYKVYMEALL